MNGIYFLTDSDTLLERVITKGLGAVQYRNKQALDYARGKKMRQLCKKNQVPFIVNDRVDLALLLDADGVHLGQDDFPIKEARALLGSDKIIGATASNLAEILQAKKDGADYIGLGHIFPTITKKKTGPPLGVESLKNICDVSPLPIFPIGGIQIEHISALQKTGAQGVCVCSAISQAVSPEEMAAQLVHRWSSIEKTPTLF